MEVTEPKGYTFVSNSMQPYSTGVTNASKIYELSENMYVSGIVNQMLNLVLQSEVSITVYDDKDDVVEDVSRNLNQMFGTDKCNITALSRSAFKDLLVWGCSIFNWVWEREGNELVCKELNHLHPYTFRVAPSRANANRVVYGRLLRGILYDKDDREIHYYQYDDSQAKEIARENLFVVRDSAATYPDGDSLILPTTPIAEFLNYAWNALGQQMSRTGAPIMFVTIKNPEPGRTINGQYIEGDIEYANKILANWGKDTLFTLRENMTVNTVEVKEGSLAIVSINKAGESIRDYISPVGMLGKDGTLIGGNSDASLRLVNNNIKGWVSLLRNNLRILPNYYLRGNSFPKTWHAEINIETTAIENREQHLQEATLLYNSKTGTPNEVRKLLGLKGVSDDELRAMMEQWNIITPQVVCMEFTEKVTNAEGDNPLSDVTIFSKKEESIMKKTGRAVEGINARYLKKVIDIIGKPRFEKKVRQLMADRRVGLSKVYYESAMEISKAEYTNMQKRKEINTIHLLHAKGYGVTDKVLSEYEANLNKGGTMCVERVLTKIDNGNYKATTERKHVSWLKDMEDDDANAIIKAVADGEREMQHPNQIAKTLETLFRKSDHNAKTAARTEAQKIRSDTRNEAFLDNGYKYVEYVTAGDENVRPEHEMRNGKIYKIEDSPWLGEYNCRCVLVPADYKVEVKGAKVTPSDAEEVSADLISDADKEKTENKREGKEVPETSRNEPSDGIENLLSNPRVPYVMMKPLSSEQPEFEKEPGKLNKGFKAYTGEGFSEINGYLRNTKRYSKVDSGTESFILKCISDMDKEISTSFIAKEVEIDGRAYSTNVLWRGIGGGNTAKRLYNAKIGDSVPDPGFQSYTCDLNTAVDWTRDNPSGFRVVLVHNVKPGEHGKLIGRASTTKNEYEIIRPRGLNETIVNIKDKTLHIKGKVVTVRMIYVE